MHASGYAPKGWKVIAVDDKDVAADSSAANAIDAKAGTVWQINDSPLPHSLTVDIGRELQIGGFSYLPPQGRNAAGVIDKAIRQAADGLPVIVVFGAVVSTIQV